MVPSNKNTLLTLYRSLIRSKLDYGCEAYHSAAQTTLKRIESIQYKALKLVTSAVHGTPLEAILAETGELPLKLRREQLLLSYWSRCTNPLVTKIWKDGAYNERTKAWTRKRPNLVPSGLKVQQLRVELECNHIEPPTGLKPGTVPPWTLTTPKVDTTLTKEISKRENPLLLRSMALCRVDSIYESAAHIYTDGSKDPVRNRTAYGILISSKNSSVPECISVRLPNGQSVYTAELEAIHHALRLAEALEDDKVVLLSDSLSALESLTSKYSASRPDTLREILEQIHKLEKFHDKEIQLCWVPSHIDIPGNERADKLARQGLELEIITEYPYSKSEIKSMTKSSINKKWQAEWDVSEKGRWYHSICPKVGKRRQCPSQNKHIETMITRLRLGHTRSSYKDCHACHTKASVSHMLLDCPQFNTARQTLREETGICTLTAKLLLAHNEQAKVYKALSSFLLKSGISQYI